MLAYLINFGLGNLVVFISLLYLLNHFYLNQAIRNFQTNLWPRAQAKYANLLKRALNWPRAILWGTVGLFILTFILISIVPPKIVFFPKGDPNFVYVYVQLPVGTDQAYTNEVIKKVEADVTKVVGKDNKDVTSIISNVTIGVTDPQSEDQGQYPNMGKVTVAFVEFGKRKGERTSTYLNKIRESVKGIPGAEITVAQEQSGPPTAKPISIEITGNNLDRSKKVS